MILKVEKTDTYQDRWSGNYNWVERYNVQVPDQLWGNQSGIIRRVKKAIGWAGVKSDVWNYGDCSFVISPRGIHQVAFVDLSHD